MNTGVRTCFFLTPFFYQNIHPFPKGSLREYKMEPLFFRTKEGSFFKSGRNEKHMAHGCWKSTVQRLESVFKAPSLPASVWLSGGMRLYRRPRQPERS